MSDLFKTYVEHSLLIKAIVIIGENRQFYPLYKTKSMKHFKKNCYAFNTAVYTTGLAL